MDSSDLSSVTASGIWMRIFRSVSFHYSVDPHNSQSVLILVIYNACLQGRREHGGRNATTLPCFFLHPEHMLLLTRAYKLCMSTVPSLSPHIRMQTPQGTDLLFTHQCTHSLRILLGT